MSHLLDAATSGASAFKAAEPMLANSWPRWRWPWAQRPSHRLYLRGAEVWLPDLGWTPFEAWCTQAGAHRARCELRVAAAQVWTLLCDAELPLANAAAAVACARQQFVHYHGLTAQGWAITAWPVTSNSQVRWGACALPLHDPAGLRLQARSTGVDLRSLRPWWSDALPYVLQHSPGLAQAAQADVAVVEGATLNWMRLRQGQLVGIEKRQLAAPTLDALGQWLAQQAHGGGSGGTTLESQLIAVIAVIGYGLQPGSAHGIALPVWPGVQMLSDLRAAGPPSLTSPPSSKSLPGMSGEVSGALGGGHA